MNTSCRASGLLFALFSGTPLIITGVTGPVLLYDEALFQFSDGVLPYLSWRVWIGLWTTVIALAVAAFQASTGFSSEIGTKLRDLAVGQAWGSCFSWAALSSNDSKTL